MSIQSIYLKRLANLTIPALSGHELTNYANHITRRSIYADGEMAKYINGITLLKKNGIYDQFVQLHMTAMAGGVAHNGPAFLPWHRRFLLEFELNMANVLNDPNYALPYWNWSADLAQLKSQNKPLNMAAVWNSNGLGANLANNTVGQPFDSASWHTHDLNGSPNIGHLIRTFSSNIGANLVTPDFLATLVETPGYETDKNGNQGFRPILEVQVHNVFHSWIGGQMDTGWSPDDPTFFLHHCFIDKLWAQWQFNFFALYAFQSSSTQPGQIAGKPMESAAGVVWDNVIGAGGMIGGISVTTPEAWEIHEGFGYRFDDEMTWNRRTLIRPTDLTASSLMGDATTNQGIGLTPFPADYHYQNGIFLLRPGYYSSPKQNKSVMIQSIPLSIQTFGANIDYTKPEQGIYYYSNSWDSGFTPARYGFDLGVGKQTDQVFELETFGMRKADITIQGFPGLVQFMIDNFPSLFYITTNNSNSALEQTDDRDQAENFSISGLPLIPR